MSTKNVQTREVTPPANIYVDNITVATQVQSFEKVELKLWEALNQLSAHFDYNNLKPKS